MYPKLLSVNFWTLVYQPAWCLKDPLSLSRSTLYNYPPQEEVQSIVMWHVNAVLMCKAHFNIGADKVEQFFLRLIVIKAWKKCSRIKMWFMHFAFFPVIINL